MTRLPSLCDHRWGVTSSWPCPVSSPRSALGRPPSRPYRWRSCVSLPAASATWPVQCQLPLRLASTTVRSSHATPPRSPPTPSWHFASPHRRRHPQPLRPWPNTQPPPHRHRLVQSGATRDPDQPVLHRPPGLEPPTQGRGPPRRRTFVTALRGLHPGALVESPLSFRKRGIFITSGALQRAWRDHPRPRSRWEIVASIPYAQSSGGSTRPCSRGCAKSST